MQLHLSAGGLYNGLILLTDDETRTYWDHISGVALDGELQGARLDAWPIQLTNVNSALRANPRLKLLRSQPGLYARFSMGVMSLAWPIVRGRLPPGFRKTMGQPDSRLPEMELGLGVITDRAQRFYRLSDIKAAGGKICDEISGLPLSIQIGDDEVPMATWSSGEFPLQLFSRWYGFAYTFPNCEVSSDMRTSH